MVVIERDVNSVKLLPLQGEFSHLHYKPRTMPWADCSLALQAV